MPLKNDKINKRACVKTYQVIERHRLIWVWVGDQDKADPSLIANFWPCSEEGWTFDGGYSPIACDYRLMIDNLIDLTHETYVHQNSIGQDEIMEAPIHTRLEGNRVLSNAGYQISMPLPSGEMLLRKRAKLIDGKSVSFNFPIRL